MCNLARGERLKEARLDAEKIILSYKNEMEANYQASLAQVQIVLCATLPDFSDLNQLDLGEKRISR